MMFHERGDEVLAISQPSHAWLSGQLLRAWRPMPHPAVVLAAEQHDIAWLDWEAAPGFDPASGRPTSFLLVPPREHAPMWSRGVERALHAWGLRVALLVSRHGSLIGSRHAARGGLDAADARALARYRAEQEPLQRAWAAALGATEAETVRDSGLIAGADALSLVLCGAFAAPAEIDFPDGDGRSRTLRVSADRHDPRTFDVAPWPFRCDRLELSCEARTIPAPGRFDDEAAMRAWHSEARRVDFACRLRPG